MLETARLYDRVGIDRLVVSDHVVFGEQLDAYGRPGDRRPARRAPTHRSRRALARAADDVERDRGDAPNACASRPASCSPRCAARSCSPRRPRPSTCCRAAGSTSASASAGNARSTKRPGSTSTSAAACSTTRSRCAPRCGPSRSRATSRPSSTFDRIHMMPKPLQPGGVPIWISGTINARVVDRLCRFGLRWIPWGDDAAEIEQSIATMRERIAAAGVDARRPAGRRQPARLQGRRRHASTSSARWRRCPVCRRGRDRPARALSGFASRTPRPKQACATSSWPSRGNRANEVSAST